MATGGPNNSGRREFRPRIQITLRSLLPFLAVLALALFFASSGKVFAALLIGIGGLSSFALYWGVVTWSLSGERTMVAFTPDALEYRWNGQSTFAPW